MTTYEEHLKKLGVGVYDFRRLIHTLKTFKNPSKGLLKSVEEASVAVNGQLRNVKNALNREPSDEKGPDLSREMAMLAGINDFGIDKKKFLQDDIKSLYQAIEQQKPLSTKALQVIENNIGIAIYGAGKNPRRHQKKSPGKKSPRKKSLGKKSPGKKPTGKN